MKTLDCGDFIPEKLIAYGFVRDGESYSLRKPLGCGMELRVFADREKTLAGVFDGDEEYTLIFTNAEGGFVGKVREEFEDAISKVTAACFERRLYAKEFSGRQTMLVIDRAAEIGEKPEFLWADTPDCAIIRRADNKKWYAVFMKVAMSKFFPGAEGTTEVINLHISSEIADGRLIFPAFHMNKRTWVSVLPDRGLSDNELLSLLADSRENSAKKERRKRQ